MLKIRIYFYDNYHVICFIPLKKKRWNYRYTKEKLIHYDGGNIPASRIPMSSMSPVFVLRTNTFYVPMSNLRSIQFYLSYVSNDLTLWIYKIDDQAMDFRLYCTNRPTPAPILDGWNTYDLTEDLMIGSALSWVSLIYTLQETLGIIPLIRHPPS